MLKHRPEDTKNPLLTSTEWNLRHLGRVKNKSSPGVVWTLPHSRKVWLCLSEPQFSSAVKMEKGYSKCTVRGLPGLL